MAFPAHTARPRHRVPRGAWAPPGFVPPTRHGTLRDRIEAGTHFRVEGQGPAVVLVHGVGLDLETWQAQAEELARDHTVIRYDLLGHGASAKPPGELTLNSFVQQLRMLHGYFGLQRFVLAGFFLGALVAQAYALRQPETLAGLIVMSGVYDRDSTARRAVGARLEQAERDGPDAVIEAALGRWFSDSFQEDHPETIAAIRQRLQNNNRSSFLAAYRVFAEADRELAGQLHAIPCPTLVMTGAQDQGSTPAMAQAMAAAIPGAEAKVLPGLAHMAPVEGAAAVNDILLDFLEHLAAPGEATP